MSDLHLGQSMSEAYRFISAGTAHTFTFGFQPDKVVFNNISNLTSAADGDIAVSTWFRSQTTDGDSFQELVIDAAGANFNRTFETTNGFTNADTSGGATAYRSLISAVSQADPCVITTTAVHGLQNDQLVRITDLGSDMPTARGMEQLNNNRYRVVVVDTTNFSLKDPVSDEAMTAGSAVMAADSDVFLIEVYKWGNFVNLGDIA